MGYCIELTYKLTDICEKTNTKYFKDLAYKYNCSSFYEHFEMSGNIKHSIRQCVLTVHFSQDNLHNCSSFVKHVKKGHNIKVESFYNEDSCELLYASPSYLKSLEKIQSNEYNLRRNKPRSYSEGEIGVLKLFK